MIQTLIDNISDKHTELNIEGLNSRFENICIYNSNTNSNAKNYIENDLLIAIDAISSFYPKESEFALNEFQLYLDNKKGKWLFGYLNYNLKNEIEQLVSKNSDRLNFPLIHFFEPKFVIKIQNGIRTIFYDDSVSTKNEVEEMLQFAFAQSVEKQQVVKKIVIENRITKREYVTAINSLKYHIQIGNIYEINFCQEFFCDDANPNISLLYKNLNKLSEAPLSAFCKFKNHYVLSSSPERFLKKEKNNLLSQPIKGTTKRSANFEEDERLKIELKNNLKEQNENVMIVDIVRNDLSKIAAKGSVHVEELFEAYSFKQVHQLISSIRCELKKACTFSDIIRATFPMGSMTGAPKISAMKLIDSFECSNRGLYSGALGYIDPAGDFDFSVVIRSILYNKDTAFLSFMTGSAITSGSEPEKEYEECLLKAKALLESIELSN